MDFSGSFASDIKKTVKRADLWDYLTPKYPIGCKRICVDPGFLPALNRSNVDLVCDPIKELNARGIVTEGKQAGGRKEREYDIIISATGWGNFSFGRGFPMYGRDGKEIWWVFFVSFWVCPCQYEANVVFRLAINREQWKDQGIPRSFMGLTMHNFPNVIFSVGPQGNVWTSFIGLCFSFALICFVLGMSIDWVTDSLPFSVIQTPLSSQLLSPLDFLALLS